MGSEMCIRDRTYIMIENDGEEIIAIDKLNGVYRVQGEDMLADVTALI